MTTPEIEAVMGGPTASQPFGSTDKGNFELDYAEEPIPTRLVVTEGHLQSIILRRDSIQEASLPRFARIIKPGMSRGGVLALLGSPQKNWEWTACKLQFEQMVFARAGQSIVSVILTNGDVSAVVTGLELPPSLLRLALPLGTSADDTGASQDRLHIGAERGRVLSAMGEALWSTEGSSKSLLVQSSTFRTPEGDGLLSLTFIAGALVAIEVAPHVLPIEGGDVSIPVTKEIEPHG
jgi:hypothetical protein